MFECVTICPISEIANMFLIGRRLRLALHYGSAGHIDQEFQRRLHHESR